MGPLRVAGAYGRGVGGLLKEGLTCTNGKKGHLLPQVSHLQLAILPVIYSSETAP